MSSTRPHSTHEVSRSPSPDLHDVLLGIQSSLDSLAERILALESADRARIGTVSMTPAPPPPPSTKGKARAQAAPAPSKAKPAKKERPTKKAPIPSEGLPLHLAQTFPQEGKPDRHLVTVAIPDATAAHVIGQGGKGLKQLHDISGARVSAYTLKSGPRDERHVSIRGTDEQIGDALVVLGKRLARKRVRGPTTKKTVPGPSADWADPAPPRVASKPRAGPSAPPSGQRPSSRVPALGPAAAPPGPSAEKWNPSATAPAFRSFTPATSSHGIVLYATLFLYPCISLSVYGRNTRLAWAAVCCDGLSLTRLYSLCAYHGHGFPLTLWLCHPCLPDGCWRCSDCCPPPANCSLRCALLGQGYIMVPSVC